MPDNKAIDAQYCAESLAEAVDNWRNDRDNEALMSAPVNSSSSTADTSRRRCNGSLPHPGSHLVPHHPPDPHLVAQQEGTSMTTWLRVELPFEEEQIDALVAMSASFGYERSDPKRPRWLKGERKEAARYVMERLISTGIRRYRDSHF
jgi:hypothetical protein